MIAPLICLTACANDESVDPNPARYEASRVEASTTHDRSFDPRAIFERLPNLRPLTQARGASSASSKLDNRDYDHYLDERNAEHVLFDSPGPGAIQRFWHTGNNDFEYRFYFDGETTPSFVAKGASFWDASSSPFVAPLMLNEFQSSGGAVGYYPIAFGNSLRITAQPIAGTGSSSLDYYDIGYERYDDGRNLASFDGRADADDLGRAWQSAGQPLIAADANDRIEKGVQPIGAGETVELAALEGPSEIIGLEFFVPALAQPIVRDDGRATFDGSRFRVALDPGNRGVRIVRRLDFHIADQTAEVFVDGVDVGTWTTPDSDPNDAWRDASFWLPSDSTRGKDAIDIRLDVAGSEWNEYRYWIFSALDPNEPPTDEVDVGDRDSELAHDYAIVAPTWQGVLAMSYPLDAKGRAALSALAQARLQIRWDEASLPAIDVPFANFFGSNADVISNVRALALGRESDRFYCYLPMPFSTRARIAIENRSALALDDFGVEIHARALPDDGEVFGTLHAQYHALAATERDRDYEILRANGTGHYVGVTMTLPNEQKTLEGNERVYVDGARSPVIAGTGTEDFFNAGWYFRYGSFETPTHGARVGGNGPVTAYRFNLTDPIPFRSSIRFTIQHGAKDDNELPYGSVAYYYQTDQTHWLRTDTLTPGDTTSANAHAYSASASRSIRASSRFLSDDPARYTMDGIELDRASGFELALAPDNDGAVLRRLSLAASTPQRADVSIDGASIGSWQSGASEDPSLAWREEDLFIPASISAGKTRIRVAIQKANGARWTEFAYELFAITR